MSILTTPIDSTEAGETFINWLFETGLMFHFDDDPADCPGLVSKLTEAEINNIRDRRDELFSPNVFADPFEYYCKLLDD